MGEFNELSEDEDDIEKKKKDEQERLDTEA